MKTEQLIERVAAVDRDRVTERAPARLKARIYSRLVNRLSQTGDLLSLTASKAGGAGLCVFEEILARLPAGEQVGSMNPCRLCHARVLAERLDRAPIFWPHCPYSEFHHPRED